MNFYYAAEALSGKTGQVPMMLFLYAGGTDG